MFSTALFVIGLIAVFHGGEGAITAWTSPTITSPTLGSGSALLFSSPVDEGTDFTVTVVATSGITLPAPTLTYTLGTKSPDVAWTLASGGLLSLAAGITDFETYSTYVVEVIVSENSVAAGTATCTLSLSDVNEATAFTGTSLTATIADGAAAVSGNTNTDFTIVASTGVVTVATGTTTVSVTVNSGAAAITACFIIVIIGIFINVMK